MRNFDTPHRQRHKLHDQQRHDYVGPELARNLELPREDRASRLLDANRDEQMSEQASLIKLTPKDIDAIERLLASNASDAAAKLYAGIFRCSMKDARRLVSQALADLGSGRSLRTRVPS